MEKEEIQFWLNIILTVFSIATFGFIIKLVSLFRNISNDKLSILRERLLLKDDTVGIVEREKERIISERDNLKIQLSNILNKKGLSVVEFSKKENSVIDNKTEGKIQEILTRLENIQIGFNSNVNTNADVDLTMAEGFYSNQEWEKASKYFDKALMKYHDNWEIYFSKGISLANLRGNIMVNLNALKAYCNAIIYFPSNSDKHIKGRIYIYRGAMYKRLLRLNEAENDIKYGLVLTNREYEVLDANYNLACIYALKKEKEKMLNSIKKLNNKQRFLNGIKYQLDNYFKYYKNDKDLLELIK